MVLGPWNEPCRRHRPRSKLTRRCTFRPSHTYFNQDKAWRRVVASAQSTKEGPMVRLFIRHDVADYDAWRQVYDEFDSTRRGLGVTGDAVFQSVDNPNDVTVWHD